MKNISKKTWIIIGAAAAVVVAIIVIILCITYKKAEAPLPGEQAMETQEETSGKRPLFNLFGKKGTVIKPGQATTETVIPVQPTKPVPEKDPFAPIVDLDGTQYRLMSFNEYTFADETAYTVSFKNNDISAKFCNGLGGNYSTKGNFIQSSTLVSTMMYCETPEKLMDAEQAFTKMMKAGAEYTMGDGTLTIQKPGTTFVFTSRMK